MSHEPNETAAGWLSSFNAALAKGDPAGLARLFEADGCWRNLSGISWPLVTFCGAERVARELVVRAREAAAGDLAIDEAKLAPRANTVAGRTVVEFAVRFESRQGPGEGIARLVAGDAPRAWTLSTGLDMDRRLRRAEDAAPQSHQRDFTEVDWSRARRRAAQFEDREPDVLVVGGGHAGITVAAEVQRLGLEALVVDRERRIGDNWRLRYSGLKLHNKTPVNHMRYMPFPATFPQYIAKDKVANWLEAYVDSLDIPFWTETSFEGATYDDAADGWTARLRRADGTARTLQPRHIVMATSVSGTPNIPWIPTIEEFGGPVLHSSAFAAGRDWSGRNVVVMGTGTSSHDIAQELHANGATVTMVQRSPTLVVNVEPAQRYDGIYWGDGPDISVRDLLNVSVPFPVVRPIHKRITDEVRALDADLLGRLEKVGFKLDFGEDGTGWPLKFRQRGGGYYFNVGCSDLIADGEIALVQASDVETFESHGLRLSDGRAVPADLVVLATGYKGPAHLLGELFGEEVARRVGPVWGIDPVSQELANMWTRTPQPGLWFTGGSFSQARIYSRYIALQIEAIEAGALAKAQERALEPA